MDIIINLIGERILVEPKIIEKSSSPISSKGKIELKCNIKGQSKLFKLTSNESVTSPIMQKDLVD